MRRDTALITAAAALALSFTPSLVARRRGDQAKISAGAAVLGGLAGSASEMAVMRLAERMRGGEGAARGVFAAGALASAGLRLPAHRRSEVALAGSAAIVAGVSAVLGAVAPERRWEPLHDPWVAALAAAIAGCAAVGAKYAQQRPARVRMDAYPGEPLPTVGGVSADFEGTRFLHTALSAGEIARLRGDGQPARDPIRVFVGVDAAATPDERADLALAELERLGAFDRPRILVCSATLRGYVNPVPVQAEELFSRGDVASVTVQYWDRPTLAMPLKVPVAARTHRALLERLAERVGTSEDGPEIVVYGESLGAWASQNVFRAEGVRALDSLKVNRALWAGTPFFSRLPRLMEKGKVPSDERVGVLNTRDLLEATEPGDPDLLRFVFLTRRTDPVVVFSGIELIWRRPEWLPRNIRWTPGITFLQLVGDLLRATRWTSDVPTAAAHDYRIELPLAVDAALGHRLPRAEAVRLADALIELEIARGERLRALRRGESDPGAVGGA